jgi:hypothetical protein
MLDTSVPADNKFCQLNCLIQDESVVFPVRVACNLGVGGLKEVIQSERAMGVLKGVDPHPMELWKVRAIDKSRCEVTWLTPTGQY